MTFLNGLFRRNRKGKNDTRLEFQTGNVRFSKDGTKSVHKVDDNTNLVIGPEGMKMERNFGNLRMTWGKKPGKAKGLGGFMAYQTHKQPKSYSQAIHRPDGVPQDPCRFTRHDFSQPFDSGNLGSNDG